jgi:predicted DCC family thiol-disulfide oxidoreductase YuxK
MGTGLLIFDGSCGLCHRAVRFLSSIPTKTPLEYVPNHTELGRELLVHYNCTSQANDTVILIHPRGSVYKKSDAVLHSLGLIKPNNILVKILLLLKNPVFDWIYDAVAHRRKKWFPTSKKGCPTQLKYGRIRSLKSEENANP